MVDETRRFKFKVMGFDADGKPWQLEGISDELHEILSDELGKAVFKEMRITHPDRKCPYKVVRILVKRIYSERREAKDVHRSD